MRIQDRKIAKRPHFAPKVERRSIPRRFPEWRGQAAIIARFHKLEAEGWPFTCAGDQNAEKRGAVARAKAKVTGITAGEPDIRIYLPNGRLGLIECKADKGKLSDGQTKRHARLKELGHEVVVLQFTNEQEAVDGAVKLLAAMLGRKIDDTTRKTESNF